MGLWILASSQRKRHDLSHKEKPVKININDVVMIKRDEKNREKWKIGNIVNILTGKDETIRPIKIGTSRSSLPEVFYKKGVLRNFAKLTGKHLCQSCGSCEISKNTFFYRIPPVAASVPVRALLKDQFSCCIP